MTPDEMAGILSLIGWLRDAGLVGGVFLFVFALYKKVLFWGHERDELLDRLAKAEARAQRAEDREDKWREYALTAQAQLQYVTGKIAPAPAPPPVETRPPS